MAPQATLNPGIAVRAEQAFYNALRRGKLLLLIVVVGSVVAVLQDTITDPGSGRIFGALHRHLDNMAIAGVVGWYAYRGA